jgi:hypothetical protein
MLSSEGAIASIRASATAFFVNGGGSFSIARAPAPALPREKSDYRRNTVIHRNNDPLAHR